MTTWLQSNSHNGEYCTTCSSSSTTTEEQTHDCILTILSPRWLSLVSFISYITRWLNKVVFFERELNILIFTNINLKCRRWWCLKLNHCKNIVEDFIKNYQFTLGQWTLVWHIERLFYLPLNGYYLNLAIYHVAIKYTRQNCAKVCAEEGRGSSNTWNWLN